MYYEYSYTVAFSSMSMSIRCTNNFPLSYRSTRNASKRFRPTTLQYFDILKCSRSKSYCAGAHSSSQFVKIVTKSKLMYYSAWRQRILLFLNSLFTLLYSAAFTGEYGWLIRRRFVTFRSTVHHYDAVDVLCLIANSCAAAAGDASLRT